MLGLHKQRFSPSDDSPQAARMLSRLHHYIGTMGLKTLHFPGHLNGWALVLTLERTETFRLRQRRYDVLIDRQPNTHSSKTVEFIGFCKGRCTLMPSSWHVVAKSVLSVSQYWNYREYLGKAGNVRKTAALQGVRRAELRRAGKSV